MTLTVTPPLFQIALSPGETWTSGIQVVNGNPYDLTVYADPVLIEAQGEEGKPRFILPAGGTAGPDSVAERPSLVSWITVPRGPIVVAPEQSAVIPLAITIPQDAQPGGHYAAVLIGNHAPTQSSGETLVAVTGSIASLLFVRVAGEVHEDGMVREFSTERMLYSSPEARFSLRFENTGNVHLQPQGDITIYNMFGKQRGFIPVNQGNDYGNVLPGSIRRFSYVWTADRGLWDIGRYRAEATLGYGLDGRQFTHATTYFYVLPVWPLVQVIGTVMFFLLMLGWAVRAYVRRAFAIEAARQGALHQVSAQHASDSQQHTPSPQVPHEVARVRLAALARPIQHGIVDMRNATRTVRGELREANNRTDEVSQTTEVLTIQDFIKRYRGFLVFLACVCIGWVLVRVFIQDVLTDDRAYQVHEERVDGLQHPLPVNK